MHEIIIGNKKITFEINKVAKQADGSAVVRIGDTEILASCTMSKEVSQLKGVLPLTIDYREREYAAGKIPGGYFKREGRPKEKEILISRLIDRSIRPMFEKKLNRDVIVSVLVLSTDLENPTDIISILGASAALSVSQIPFLEPIGAVRIAKVNGDFLINPTLSEKSNAAVDVVITGKDNSIIMIEGGGTIDEDPTKNSTEDDLIAAINIALPEINKICNFQKELIKQYAKEKIKIIRDELSQEQKKEISDFVSQEIKNLVKICEKKEREKKYDEIRENCIKKFSQIEEKNYYLIYEVIDEIYRKTVRDMILNENIRVDGRRPDQMREITADVGVLPRTHGSALFTRGQTQSLATVTLGTAEDMQSIDELEVEYKERFLFHYNFPGFATGEARPDRSISRREIGHGNLARRALLPLIPDEDIFPYAIRMVSDILESNGSSSMASVCSGSLALFDAGVLLKTHCAGIAMGLIKQQDKQVILTDISGIEDHFGDMDFKIAGTSDAVTAVQLDLKTDGVDIETITQILAIAKQQRNKILKIMNEKISKPREKISEYAPRLKILSIPQEKIAQLIGPGGRNIRKIIEQTGSTIDILETPKKTFQKVYISSPDEENLNAALRMINELTSDIEEGKIYQGKVSRVAPFGVFVEIFEGKEGLVHISKIDKRMDENINRYFKEGNEVKVKVLKVNDNNRIELVFLPETIYRYLRKSKY